MISVAGFIGADPLAALSRSLQDAINGGDPDAYRPILDRFGRDLAAVAEGVRAFLGRT
jgi:hypothetical protein